MVDAVVTRALIRLTQVTDTCLKRVIKEDGEEINFTQVSRPSPPSSSVSDYPPRISTASPESSTSE